MPTGKVFPGRMLHNTGGIAGRRKYAGSPLIHVRLAGRAYWDDSGTIHTFETVIPQSIADATDGALNVIKRRFIEEAKRIFAVSVALNNGAMLNPDTIEITYGE